MPRGRAQARERVRERALSAVSVEHAGIYERGGLGCRVGKSLTGGFICMARGRLVAGASTRAGAKLEKGGEGGGK